MQNLTQPTLLLKPFAQSGDKNTLPDVNPDTDNPQLADLTNGFPQITSLSPDDGGLPPERKDFNGLGYLTTSYDFFYQAGGTFTYSPTIASAIGGYPLGARLWYTNPIGVSMIVRSTIENNTNNFLTDSSVIGMAGEGKPWERENFLGYTAPYKLLQHSWFDYELDDMSWLNADTFSWQDGTVYSEVYSHLVSDIDDVTPTTELVGSYTITYYQAEDGHKIVMADQETTVQAIYGESGAAWYYILDTTNSRFKLPRVNPAREELIQIIRAKGNGITVGVVDGDGNNFGMLGGDTGHTIKTRADAYGVAVGDGGGTSTATASGGLGITADSTKSGIVSDMADSTSVYKGKKYLYFYVGQYSQSATEQTAGLNTSLFNGKIDIDGENATLQTAVGFNHAGIRTVIETYKSGTYWYRVWSDGWIEQGGAKVMEPRFNTINLLKEFSDTDYTVCIAGYGTEVTSGTGQLIRNKTTTTFDFWDNATGYTGGQSSWYCCGF